MALIVLTSAAGAPGVTTAVLGLALTWHGPVLLVEADPTGGSALLAGYFRGQTAPTQTLIDLAFAHRAGALVEAIPSVSMQIPDTPVRMIAGTRSHGQARSLTPLWEPLASALEQLDAAGQDVIVDAGRLGLAGAPEPLVSGADLCLLVTRTDWSPCPRRARGRTRCAAVRGAGRRLRVGAADGGGGAPVPGSGGRQGAGAAGPGVVAWDEEAAAVFSHGAPSPRGFDRGHPRCGPTSTRADGLVPSCGRDLVAREHETVRGRGGGSTRRQSGSRR